MNIFIITLINARVLSLIAGFRSLEDILFKPDIKRWSEKLDVLVTVDKADEDYNGNVGLVTKYIPNLNIENLDNMSAIVVGPPMMMKFTVEEFLKRDIAENNIWVSYEEKCAVVLENVDTVRWMTLIYV